MVKANVIPTNTFTTINLKTWIPYAESKQIYFKTQVLLKKIVENVHFSCSLSICKEVADGLRVYFDFTLADLLLYSQEKVQFSELTKCESPFQSPSIKKELE